MASGSFIEANPSSQHSSGKLARKVVNQTKAQVFKTFSFAESQFDLFFHSGATEGLVTSALSFYTLAKKKKKKFIIYYSSLDHAAVTQLKVHPLLSDTDFYLLPLTNDLEYDHKEIKSLIEKTLDSESLALYFHLWVHNETGMISDLESLSYLKSFTDLFLHIDAVQSVGKIQNWNSPPAWIDMVTFSGHKFGALKGVGFSFISKHVEFFPLISGGAQQGNLRSGTENAVGIYSLELALQDAKLRDFVFLQEAHEKMKILLKDQLKRLGGVVLDFRKVAPNTIYFYFEKMSSDVALAFFDLNGLELSAGSACSSGTAKESLVLKSLHLDSVSKNGLRLSFNPQIKQEELSELLDLLKVALNKLPTI